MHVRNCIAAAKDPDMTIVLIISLVTLSIAFAGPTAAAVALLLYVGYFVFVNVRKYQYVTATMIALGGTAAMLLLFSAHAWAAADPASTPTATTISLAPIFAYFGPTINVIAASLVSAALSGLVWLLVKLLQLMHINIDTARFDVIKASAAKIVSAWFASQTAAIAARTYTTNDKTVLDLVNLVEQDVLPFVQRLGLNKAQLAVFVQAEIGKLQTALLPSLGSAAVVPANPRSAVQK